MEIEKQKCHQCDMPLLSTDRFCPFCGRRQPNPMPWQKRMARGITLFLFVLMGLPAGLAGCCGILGVSSGGGPEAVLLAVGSILVFSFALWLFIRAWKK